MAEPITRKMQNPLISLFIQVSHAYNYFIAKSAERRGRSCAGPQTMFDIFLKKGWDII